MLGSRSPISLLRRQVSTLLPLLEGIRDGDEKAIHDARVTTRRIRETLAVAAAGLEEHEHEASAKILRRTGRALGEVRESDAAHELLLDLEARLPPNPVLARLRAITAESQQPAAGN